jgi:hypothetical protein
MSSTDPAMKDQALLTFFRKEVVVAGERLRAAGQAVALHPEPGLETYYSRRDSHPLIFTAEEVQIDRVTDMWRRVGRGELCPLSSTLQSLSRVLETEQQSGEPSPFIYSMF